MEDQFNMAGGEGNAALNLPFAVIMNFSKKKITLLETPIYF